MSTILMDRGDAAAARVAAAKSLEIRDKLVASSARSRRDLAHIAARQAAVAGPAPAVAADAALRAACTMLR
jgi:hypothetical protein